MVSLALKGERERERGERKRARFIRRKTLLAE
jgi:hypothetical protein